jgi:hypothetical protein
MTQSFRQASPEVPTLTSAALDVRPVALLLYLHRLLLYLARVPVHLKLTKTK